MWIAMDSGAWMGVLIDIEQSLLGHVGVDLGRGRVVMTKQFLDASQIGPAVEQVGCKAMAQRMGAGAAIEAEADEVGIEEASDAPCGQPGPEAIEEHGRLVASCRLPERAPSADPGHGHLPDRAEPLAAPLAPHPRQLLV